MAQQRPISGAPSVRYAQTDDGFQIAFSISGSGRSTVYLPVVPWFTLGMVGPLRALIHSDDPGFAPDQRTILYDARGAGLSPGDEMDLSLESQLADLHAVVEAAHNGPVVVVASLHGGPVGIAYAARYPDHVSALVLWGATARGADFSEHPRLKTLFSVAPRNWEVFTDSSGIALLGAEHPEASAALSELIREALTPEVAHRALQALAGLDVTSILGDVRVPTLVAGRLSAVPSTAVVRELARAIPGGRLALARGTALSPLLDDSEEASGAIRQFLDEVLGPEAAVSTQAAPVSSEDLGLEPEPLTERELETLRLAADGLANREIAARLGVTLSTVKKHIHNCNVKLGTGTRSSAAARGRELGLL